MNKLVILFILLFIGTVGYAKGNYVEADKVNDTAATMDPEQLDGWYETNTHFTSRFSYGPFVSIPSGTKTVYLFIDNPVLSTYTFTTMPAENHRGSSGNYLTVVAMASQTVSGTTVQVTGYCPAVGHNVTKVFVLQ